MYHWYLLLKYEKTAVIRVTRSSSEKDVQAIIAYGKSRRLESLSPGEKRRLLWLGLLEAIPASVGTAAGLNLESTFASVGSIVLGGIASVVVIWLLRERVPELPIEIAESTSFDDV